MPQSESAQVAALADDFSYADDQSLLVIASREEGAGLTGVILTSAWLI